MYLNVPSKPSDLYHLLFYGPLIILFTVANDLLTRTELTINKALFYNLLYVKVCV